jgi:hypothetical protein
LLLLQLPLLPLLVAELVALGNQCHCWTACATG